jgi:hypothetical protein
MLRYFIVMIIGLLAQPALAATPSIALESQIAYQQGQFAGLYERCGSAQEKAVIGGSAAQWRAESLAGYQGSLAEQRMLDQAYTAALGDINNDPHVCRDWTKQAAAIWRSITRLAMYGTPVVFRP